MTKIELLKKVLGNLEEVFDAIEENEHATPQAVDEMLTEMHNTVSQMQWREMVDSL